MRPVLGTARLALAALLSLGAGPTRAQADFLPIIDAHSQIDTTRSIDEVVALMDEAKVGRVILSSLPRRVVRPEEMLSLAARYPDRILPGIMAKGQAYENDEPRWYKSLSANAADPRFSAIAEAHLYHAAKGRAGEVTVYPSDARIAHLVKVAKRRNWPVVLHAELANSGAPKTRILRELETLMAENRDQAFALIHMAQLDAGEVEALISRHANIYFLTSHANHLIIQASGRQRSVNHPWTDMFDGERLAAPWRRLIAVHPDRFVLAFDNTITAHWSGLYARQAVLWRRALAELPRPVAEAVAFRNAERLWHLRPTP